MIVINTFRKHQVLPKNLIIVEICDDLLELISLSLSLSLSLDSLFGVGKFRKKPFLALTASLPHHSIP